ncbi:hypothetical protein QR680_007538 [Steinernema hermaphroditum]|uniref:Nuclear receptor domain-containing protein n=1 Tax=Steinernema hermaphroditum TaxID=289476 RepID=A0AA39M5J0_9BILA|nr:hypothetical protein QR680_007538 [Steinernema hermaphroditum]
MNPGGNHPPGHHAPSAFVPVDPNLFNAQNPLQPSMFPLGPSMLPLGYNPALLQAVLQHHTHMNPNIFPGLPTTQLDVFKRESEQRDSGNESCTSGSLSPMSTRSSRSNSNQFNNNFAISSLLPSEPKPQTPVEQKPVVTQPSTPPRPTPLPPVSQMTPQTPLAPLQPNGFLHSPWPQQYFPNFPIPMNQSGFAQMNALYGSPGTPQMMMPPGSELCVVCGDKASGHHYGVVSCEGCKGFFRRSVQKNCTYECAKDSKCAVARHTRNRCQSCRYEKCLKEGMTRESVRQDRNKSRKNREDQDSKQLDEMRRIQSIQENVVSAYKATLGENLPADRSNASALIKLFLAGVNEFVDIPDVVKDTQIEKRFDAFIALRRLVMSDPCVGLIRNSESEESGNSSALERLRSLVADDTLRFEEMTILSTWCLLHSYSHEVLSRHQDDLSSCLKAQLATHDKQAAHFNLMLISSQLCA